MNINRKWVYPLAAAGMLLLAGCSTSTGSSASASPASAMASPSGSPGMTMSAPAGTGSPSGMQDSMAMMIHIKNFAYQTPASVAAGSTVTVMNMDNEAHTVTADDGSFNVVVKPGATATFTAPAKPGSYPFKCTYHSNMHGTLTVK